MRLTMATATSMAVLLCSFHVAATKEKQLTYIVHMDKPRMMATFAEHNHWYDASLHFISDSIEILYSYDTVANDFYRLTPTEAQALESLNDIPSVLLEIRY